MNYHTDRLINKKGHQEEPEAEHPNPIDQAQVPLARVDEAVGLVELEQVNDAAQEGPNEAEEHEDLEPPPIDHDDGDDADEELSDG